MGFCECLSFIFAVSFDYLTLTWSHKKLTRDGAHGTVLSFCCAQQSICKKSQMHHLMTFVLITAKHQAKADVTDVTDIRMWTDVL